MASAEISKIDKDTLSVSVEVPRKDAGGDEATASRVLRTAGMALLAESNRQETVETADEKIAELQEAKKVSKVDVPE